MCLESNRNELFNPFTCNITIELEFTNLKKFSSGTFFYLHFRRLFTEVKISLYDKSLTLFGCKFFSSMFEILKSF